MTEIIACFFCSFECTTALRNLEAFSCKALRSESDIASWAWFFLSCEVHLATDAKSSL